MLRESHEACADFIWALSRLHFRSKHIELTHLLKPNVAHQRLQKVAWLLRKQKA